MDRNKNNKLDYVLVEGEGIHFDAIRRMNGFLENSQNINLNQLENISADWQRTLASEGVFSPSTAVFSVFLLVDLKMWVIYFL